MPLFEYQCQQCTHQFEALVRGAERPACPSCQSHELEKLLSTSAAHVGGSRASLPLASSCPPSDAPPCGPGCCRL